jgi:hypothetical protein
VRARRAEAIEPIDPSSPRYGSHFDIENRRVDETHVGALRVSTVFLGVDHNFTDRGSPVLFETMVFGANDHNDRYCDRYCTAEEAREGHARVVAALGNGSLKLDE